MSTQRELALLSIVAVLSLPAASHAAPPPAPASCNVAPGPYAGASITWTDVTGETGYRVYRDGGALTTTGPGVTNYLDLAAPGAGTYNYCIEAVNLDGASGQCCAGISVAAPPITVEPKHWLQDTFTSNETLVPDYATIAAFDTTSAWIRTGLNLAAFTGDATRQDLPGDTLVCAAPGAPRRVDLVFRIVPGVGNYVQRGNRASGLRRVPTSAAAAVPGAASANFWESFLADNGAVGTGGNGVSGPGHPGGKWDPNLWNSARCDTAETNVFPVESRLTNLPGIVLGRYASMYHEADPKFVTLGVPKRRCFIIDPSGAINSTNITCGEGTYPPAWAGNATSGMAPSEGGLAPGVTREFSQIIPDGQLTPGSHVQYFLRFSDEGAPQFALGMTPDTNLVVPQPCGSLDCARWAQFGVLPDRWKDSAFGGEGGPCMLLVDLDDGKGNECAWVAAADSVPRDGMTAVKRRGAHNGWANAPWGADPNDPIYFVRAHGGQPGSAWDLYSVRGSRDTLTGNAGSLGGRLAPRCTGCPSAGRESRQGPTFSMLRTFYRVVTILTGDRNARILGPLADRGQADVSLLQDYLSHPLPSDPFTHNLTVMGSGFAESEVVGHPTFMASYLGAALRGPDYTALSGNPAPGTTLTWTAYGYQFGLVPRSLDVLTPLNPFDPSCSSANTMTFGTYDPFGPGAPFVAVVRRSCSTFTNWVTLLSGFDFADLRGTNWTSKGRTDYLEFMSCLSQPHVDVPVTAATDRAWLSLGNNPLKSGAAAILLALPKPDRVTIGVYDIAGRKVRTISERTLEAGAHSLTWDATDAAGRRISPGVYLVRASTASGLREAKALVVLR